MSLEERVGALRNRHQSLEQQLASEISRPHPDESVVAKLKREKLKLKDEIARLGTTAH
jgi:hypothetical protein